MSSIRYEFFMSQIKHMRDMKENEKIKISFVFYEGCQGPCIFKICKNRDLSEVYQALMEIRHPHLAVVYDCIYENGNTYVLEEYIPGKTLAELLKEKGTFSEEETARIMTELCGGLEVLHRHEPPIIHNDIKTSNIMIREDGTVKLFDFDISRTFKEGSYKNTKLMGTHEYAAPEHYGFGQSEPCTDIYSLGVTMHEMLTGEGLDYEHKVTYEGSLAQVIRKCVEIDRKKRYASAALLKADLDKGERAVSFRWLWLLGAVCGMVLLVVGGVYINDYLAGRSDGPDVPVVEGTASEEDTQADSEADTERVPSTEESESSEGSEDTEVTEESEETEEDIEEGENGEDTQVSEETEKPEDIEDSTTPESSQGSESMEEPPTEGTEDAEETEERKANVVHQLQGDFLTMNAWGDGTFVFMERISGKCYLRCSDGREKYLEGVRAGYDAQLEYNPYIDQMYLIVFDYSNQYIYAVSKDLELEYITQYDIGGKTGEFVAFYSDGTMQYGGEHLRCEDWSLIDGISYGPQPVMIRDKIYSFEAVYSGTKPIHVFLESDEEGNVVRDFIVEEEGIQCGTWMNTSGLYCNSKAAYFIGTKEFVPYLYCFDGEKFIQMENVPIYSGYEALCVTDTAIRYLNEGDNRIIEVILK